MTDNINIRLGFVNTPYIRESMQAPMRAGRAESARKRRRGFRTTKTADKVAEFLEDKYGIIETFFDVYKDDIIEIIGNDVVEQLMSRSPKKSVFGTRGKMEEIQKLFRQFLDHEGMAGYANGVPTLAALTGEGRVTKRPGVSFIDTGIYRAAFRAWIV